MRPEDIVEIRQLQLFKDCGQDTFDELMKAGFLQRFPPGVVLIQESDPADFLYIVVDGLVEMYANNAGRETTLAFVHPIGTFILAAVLKDNVYLQSARTLEKSRVLMIPAENVRKAMHRDVAFMSAIVIELANCYRSMVRDLKNQKLRTGTERLANWLLRERVFQNNGDVVDLTIEKRVLAARLGMTPENLSRAFGILKPYSVCVDGSRIELNDIAALNILAKPNPLIDDQSDEN